jgi:plastocyanin
MRKKAFVGLLLLGLLSVVMAACTIRDASVASGPSVRMLGADFAQHTITLKKGEQLHLVNASSSPHIVTNGTWANGEAKAGSESGAPQVKMNFVGNDSATTPPFNTAGSFNLYCPIHGGMNLTVNVE